MKGLFRKVLSTVLALTICLGVIPLMPPQVAEAGELSAVPGPGTYSVYQNVYLYNETADESGITYSVSWRPTLPNTSYNPNLPIKIDEDVILSVYSTVGTETTHKEFSYTINPYILSTYPSEGATNVPVDPKISIAFSRKMNQDLLETSSNIIISRLSPDPVTDVTGFTYSYNPGTYILDIAGLNLDHGATYMVSLSNNIKDSDGKSLLGNKSFTFTTVSAGDSITYGSVTTDKNSYGKSQNVNISGTYSQGANEVDGAVDLELQVLKPNGVRDATISVTSVAYGRFSEIYTLPDSAMTGEWKVRLYDGNTPRQLIGTATFTVVEDTVTKPSVSHDTYTHYEPIYLTLASATSGASIYYVVDYDSDDLVAEVAYSVPHDMVDSSATLYQGPIYISNAGKTRVRARAIKGGIKSDLLDVTYTIKADLGYLQLTPTDGSVNVSVLTSVSSVFGRSVKSQSVNSQSFRLRESATGSYVAGEVSYNAEKKTATFKPAGQLKASTSYQAILSGYTGGLDSAYIEDMNGVKLSSDVIWSFTTGSQWINVDGIAVVGDYVTVNKNPVTVVVTAADASAVTLNKSLMAATGSGQFTGSVSLKQGKNAVTIEITDNLGAKTTQKITVDYLNILQVGAGVVVSIPEKGKLELFDKQLTMNLPRGTYLKDSSGLPLSDQSIIFNVYQTTMPDGFPSVSYLYEIQPQTAGAELNNSGEGTITFTYDKYVSATSAASLTVLCDPDSDGLWEENLGGKVDTKKRTITVPFGSFGKYVVVNKVWTFNDYSTTGWARPYVEYLWSKGFMKPLETAGVGRFGLVDSQDQEVPITRGEFAVMLGKVLGMNKFSYVHYGIYQDMRLFESANPPYALVRDRDGNWRAIDDDDYKYIDMLTRNGILQGSVNESGNRIFNFDNIISREEVAVMLTRAMSLLVETDNVKVSAAITKLYSDADTSIGDWAQPYVLAASKGYFGGYPDKTFKGKDNFTRPQAARIVYLAMQKAKLM